MRGGIKDSNALINDQPIFVFKITFYEEEGTLVEKGKAVEESLKTSGMKVLLCEDNEVNIKVASMILKRLNFDIDVAEMVKKR